MDALWCQLLGLTVCSRYLTLLYKCHCSREAQPTERFYKSVRLRSQVHTYKMLYLWWLRSTIHRKNRPCRSFEDPQEVESETGAHTSSRRDGRLHHHHHHKWQYILHKFKWEVKAAAQVLMQSVTYKSATSVIWDVGKRYWTVLTPSFPPQP